MMKKLTSRGFTLIELLVVIAIIGILASVVLASLNSARDKGTDAARKSNLNNIRAQSEIVYDDNGDYDAVCTDANVSQAVSASGGSCTDDANEWAASAVLTDGTSYYCVDYKGRATTSAAAHGTADGDIDCD